METRDKIEEGTLLETSKDIRVTESLSEVEIVSEGDVIIDEGVTDSRIVASGNITASFIQRSELRSDENIKVQSALMHCEVLSCKELLVVGEEKFHGIIGGTIRAIKKITTHNLGSNMGVTTTIEAGLTPDKILDKENLQFQGTQINAIIKKINHFVEISKGTLNEDDAKYKRLLAALSDNRKVLSSVVEKLNAINKHVSAVIIVSGMLYTGVVIKMGTAKHHISDDRENVRITFDQEKSEIVIQSEK